MKLYLHIDDHVPTHAHFRHDAYFTQEQSIIFIKLLKHSKFYVSTKYSDGYG